MFFLNLCRGRRSELYITYRRNLFCVATLFPLLCYSNSFTVFARSLLSLSRSLLIVVFRFELVFVMVFFPGVLNVMYFWIADSYLKQSHPEGSEPMALDDESGGDYHHSNEGEGRGRTGSDPMMMNSSAGNLGLLTEEVVLGKGKTKKKGKGAFEMTSIVPEEPVWLKQAEKGSADRYHGIGDMAL